MAANPQPPAPAPPAPPLHNWPDVQHDDDLRGLRDIQRSNRVFFNYWRNGDLDRYDKLNAAKRAEERAKAEHPVERAAKPILDKVKPHVIREDWDDGTVEIEGPAWMVKAKDRGDLRVGGLFINMDPPKPAWERAKNAVNEMARELYSMSGGGQRSHLRFVKLLGAGGQGFVALFDARRERQAGVPWDVNFYVVKGVLRPEVISPQRFDRKARKQRQWYAEKVRRLYDEKLAQLDMIASQHTVQCFGNDFRHQLERLKSNITNTPEARAVDQRDALLDWAGNGQPAWTNWKRHRAAAEVRPRIGQARTADRKAALSGAQPPPARPARAARLPQVAFHPPGPPTWIPGVAYSQNPLVEHGYQQMEVKREMLFLEYLPRGDLFRFIERMNGGSPTGGPERPPNRVLWLIWQCFLKMVVALDQPVGEQRRRAIAPKDHDGPLGSEAYVDIPHGQPGFTERVNYVHFDIDPENIFVGPSNCTGIIPAHVPPPSGPMANLGPPTWFPNANQREDGHGNVPLFKLGDFGIAESRNPNVNRNINRKGPNRNYDAEAELHNLRRCGKTPFYTPEQFTEEWDTVNLWPFERPNPNAAANAAANAPNANPAPAPAPVINPPNPHPAPPNPPANRRKRKRPDHYVPPRKKPTRQPPNQTTRLVPQTPVLVAGLYGWKTNLYQLALTMWCIITGYCVPRVPVGQRIIKTTITPDPNGGDPQETEELIYTYGGYLLDDRQNFQCDRELRETLALCLAERPGDRPDHEWLTQQVKRKLAYYAAVDQNIGVGAPPVPAFTANDWAPDDPHTNAPPSERVYPSMDRVMNWSDRAFGQPPPTRLRDSTEYDQWLGGIVQHQRSISYYTPTTPTGRKTEWEGDFEYRYHNDLKDLREV